MGKGCFSAVYRYPTAVSTSVQEKKAIPVARCGGRYFNGCPEGQAGKREDSKRISVSIVYNSSSNMSSPPLRLNQ